MKGSQTKPPMVTQLPKEIAERREQEALIAAQKARAEEFIKRYNRLSKRFGIQHKAVAYAPDGKLVPAVMQLEILPK